MLAFRTGIKVHQHTTHAAHEFRASSDEEQDIEITVLRHCVLVGPNPDCLTVYYSHELPEITAADPVVTATAMAYAALEKYFTDRLAKHGQMARDDSSSLGSLPA